MLKSTNRFRQEKKARAHYERITGAEIYRAYEIVKDSPHYLDEMEVMWRNAYKKRNREMAELFLSGVRPYFISRDMLLDNSTVSAVCKKVVQWVLEKDDQDINKLSF